MRREGGQDPQGEADMQDVVKFLNRVIREEEGQDMVEYALLLALISIVAVASLILAGSEIKRIWSATVTALQSTVP
jgi:Flp pilus assembly pilin Flp